MTDYNQRIGSKKKNIFERLRSVVYVNILTVKISFFSLLSIFGLRYGGAGESTLYINILIISSIITYLFLLVDIVFLKRFKGKTVYLLTLPFLVLLTYGVSGVFSAFNNFTLAFFILLGIPSLLVGYVLGTRNEIVILRKGFIVVAILVFFGILRSFNALITADHYALSSIFGGGQYQALSYFSSFGFSSLLANYIFFRKRRTVLSTALYFVAFTVLILGVVLSGGRGGAVVVIISTLVFSVLKYGYGSTFVKVIFIVFMIIFITTTLQGSEIYFRIIRGGSRLFSYISDSGLDLSQTSNRDLVWEHTLKHIKESWLYGYGPFTYEWALGKGFFTHNLFLDFFIHGGLIYVLIWLMILIRFFSKMRRIIKRDMNSIIFLIPFLNVFIMLMFSSTYLQEGLFWFSLVYIFSYRNTKVSPSIITNIS